MSAYVLINDEVRTMIELKSGKKELAADPEAE